jgi:hypothetical protein
MYFSCISCCLEIVVQYSDVGGDAAQPRTGHNSVVFTLWLRSHTLNLDLDQVFIFFGHRLPRSHKMRPPTLLGTILVGISAAIRVSGYDVPVSDKDDTRQVCSGMYGGSDAKINGWHLLFLLSELAR